MPNPHRSNAGKGVAMVTNAHLVKAGVWRNQVCAALIIALV